ncbi:imidazoleglycerol-phosphate dehydratase 1, chloroplastic-like isoform X5 [Macadamia integrifolia]|uniref:imidazoleglycerol-phosphate dehydratase 1, chloroplastic-like isoform X5 n=1 Tax=Macadamia integrifolia TaxID=60698 RepID=UPI001C4FBE61|nr:imidazoleglycerol-phosphate dehydratase 1, chloroplastic-like isoform X5 [Macadamia integrifolia]
MELISQSALLTCPSSQSLKSRVHFVDFSKFIFPKRPKFSTQPQNLRPMEAQRTVSCVSGAGENGSPVTTIPQTVSEGRIGEVKRVTKETNVYVKLNLDGSGIADSSTSIPFLDHMLDQLASHGLFDVHVRASGDTYIDDHHTNEDVALAIGTSLLHALGDRKGINRFGDFSAPLDETLIHVSLLVEHFFQSIVNTPGMTLHIQQLAGKNFHHIIEATFKAFARALRKVTEYDPRRLSYIPSSKGVLSRS